MITPLVQSTDARSIAFLSSRTLPGHEYRRRAAHASAVTSGTARPDLGRRLLEEQVHQALQLTRALSERRHGERDAMESKIEVLPERPGLDCRLQVDVGGRDDPDVHRMRFHAPHPPNLTLIEHLQQLLLGRERHLADLVEEERPTVCRVDETGLGRERSGESAPLVSEELRFEDGLGELGTVQGDEGPGGARREPVELGCEDALPHAGFPQEQDVDRAGGDALQQDPPAAGPSPRPG